MQHSNKFLISLFRLLEERGVSYCVLRNFQSLPDSCGGSDLDMWVSEKDFEVCKSILAQISHDTHSPLVSYTGGKDCPKLCYLNVNSGVQIDLFKGIIVCKGKQMFGEEDIIANTKIYNGIKVLDERFGDLMAFLKEILNNGKCEEKYSTPLSEHKELFQMEYLWNDLRNFDKNFCELLAKTIIEGSYKENIAKLTIKGRACLGIKGVSSKIDKISNLRRFFKPTGYVIAVLGTDGSGKSFIINSITPIIDEAFHKGVRYEHMRPNHLPSLAVASGRKKASDKVEVVSDPHASKPSGFIGSVIRLSYYWLDYTYGYLRKVFVDKSVKTHVWIFDRYYYDYYVDQRRARLHLPNWIIRMYGLFVPTPDLTLCLGGDPEKIYARKPETSLEEVTRQTEVLREFARKHKKAVWVDTTIKPEESIEAAMTAIVKMMSKRFVR